MMQRLLIAVTGAFVLLGAAAIAALYVTTPITFKIAVASDGEDARLMSAIATQLVRDRAPYRFEFVARPNPAEASAALDAGLVDLALVRRDLGMPRNGRALVTLRRNFVVIVGPPDATLEKIADLRGQRIGVIGRGAINLPVLDTILAQHGLTPTSVRAIPINPEEVASVVRDGRVDLLMAAGPITGRGVSEAVNAMTREGREPTFLPVGESKAIAQRTQLYDASEIVAGAFGGRRPAQTFETIGFSHFIVARSSLAESDAGELARVLFEMRPMLSADFPATARIEAPDTDKGAPVAVHPGAAAYFDGEQKTFFDRYGDFFYYGILALSVIGSALAGIGSFTAGHRNRKENRLGEPLEIVRRARLANDEAELNALQERADALLVSAVDASQRGILDEIGLLTFSLVLEQARSAIRERRRTLGHTA
jgi:TRAP transporter TAXI family solute receptor